MLQLPTVVFGSTSLGNLFVEPSDVAKHELVKSWFAQGSRPVFIDSAGKYGAGLALEVITRELAALKIDPNDVLISNKLGWRRSPLTTDEPTFEPGVWINLEHDAVQDISYDGILRCYSEGSKLLAPYQANWLSVHDPDEYLDAAISTEDRQARFDDIVGAYRALSELKAKGKASAIGIGAKNWRVIEEVHHHCELDWVMFANSLTVMQHPNELLVFIEKLHREEIQIINSAVTHGGFITGGNFLDYREIDPVQDSQELNWRNRFNEICSSHDVSPYVACVEFGLAHPAVQSVALSSSKPERTAGLLQAATSKAPVKFWRELATHNLIATENLIWQQLVDENP